MNVCGPSGCVPIGCVQTDCVPNVYVPSACAKSAFARINPLAASRRCRSRGVVGDAGVMKRI
ncbi:hypothetical protein R54767_02185 [Paraburkholderia gardini]|uniref:Uncharacterized protein n=1 Tax=Paraburkholderia gardini TaxID=2823469 RepID=A0ABM8U385_9BURK|nr:hypothetical protein R54767_02185 [Paraburkholderia gardini]